MAMGNQHHPFFDRGEPVSRPCSDVLVAASAQYLRDLNEAQITRAAFPGLRGIEVGTGEDLPADCGRGCSLAILEVDPADPHSMERLSRFHRSHAGVPVIAATRDTSLSLVRTLLHEGVADVVELPFRPDELLATALDVLAQARAAHPSETKLAPMVVVVRSIGGCGTTSIATHLAAELGAAIDDPREAAIVDLDLQFGTVAEYLGAQGKGSIIDLIDAGERLDEELIRSIAHQNNVGLAVFAAPKDIVPLETVDAGRLLHVLDMLRRTHASLVIDLPADWTDWALSVAAEASAVLMVVELSLPSLRQARRQLDLLGSIGIPAKNIEIVVNRMEHRLFPTIGFEDVAHTLGHPVLASVTQEAPLVSTAQNQGLLVMALRRKSRFGADVAQIARQLLQRCKGAMA